MANKRVYYAVHGIAIAAQGSTAFTAVHGVQSLGVNKNFTIEQIYELGKLDIYANVEGVPEVEITVEKVLDGWPLVYHMATSGALDGSLAGRQNMRCNLVNSICVDTQLAVSGTPIAQVYYSGLYISSIGYTFDTSGPFKESVSLVGNNAQWLINLDNISGTPYAITGGFTPTDAPVATEGVDVRQHFDRTNTRFPKAIAGVNQSTGTISDVDAQGFYKVHPTKVAVTCSLGREGLYELGKKGPYFRFAQFPTEVGCEITINGIQGDEISFTEEGVNTVDEAIFIQTQEGTKLNLGAYCRLRSSAQSGGDAGQSSNMSHTYRYVTYNDLLVSHPNDVTAALRL